MYTQHAKGSFSVQVSGPYHCGPNHDSPKKFDFEVLIEWPSKSPDYRGFLLDNTVFQDYFDTLGEVRNSCEVLAKDCAEEFHKIAGRRPSKVCVRIWAIQGTAMVEYSHEGRRVRFIPEAIASLGFLAELGRIFMRH